MPLKSFWTHELSDLFVIDWSMCIINGEINNEHLFSTFAQFSDEDPESVCTDIIERIESGKHIYNAVGLSFLNVEDGILQNRQWPFVVNIIMVMNYYYL